MSYQHTLRSPGDFSLPIDLEVVDGLIEGMAQLIGEERLRSTLARAQRIASSGECAAGFQRSIQPWAFGFLDYARKLDDRVDRIEQLSAETLELAAGVFIFAEVAQSMPGDVKAKFLGDICGEKQLDVQHEIFTAWLLMQRGYELQWINSTGEGRRPELVAYGHGIEFDVECRRFSHDFSEKIATQHTAEFCDLVLSTCRGTKAWGTIEIEIPERFSWDPVRRRAWKRSILDAITANQTTVTVEAGPTVDLRLQHSMSPQFTQLQIQALTAGQPHDQIWLTVARSSNESYVEPVTFKCRVPRRTPLELLNSVYRTLKPKTREQLRDVRAGMLAVRFDGAAALSEEYPRSPFAKEMNRKLFAGADHLTAISYLPRPRTAVIGNMYERQQGGWEVVRMDGKFSSAARVLSDH